MKNIVFKILPLIFLFSCSAYNESKKLNIKNAKIAHQKFININNDLSYNEYKSLIIEYGKNNKFPDIN